MILKPIQSSLIMQAPQTVTGPPTLNDMSRDLLEEIAVRTTPQTLGSLLCAGKLTVDLRQPAFLQRYIMRHAPTSSFMVDNAASFAPVDLQNSLDTLRLNERLSESPSWRPDPSRFTCEDKLFRLRTYRDAGPWSVRHWAYRARMGGNIEGQLSIIGLWSGRAFLHEIEVPPTPHAYDTFDITSTTVGERSCTLAVAHSDQTTRIWLVKLARALDEPSVHTIYEGPIAKDSRRAIRVPNEGLFIAHRPAHGPLSVSLVPGSNKP